MPEDSDDDTGNWNSEGDRGKRHENRGDNYKRGNRGGNRGGRGMRGKDGRGKPFHPRGRGQRRGGYRGERNMDNDYQKKED